MVLPDWVVSGHKHLFSHSTDNGAMTEPITNAKTAIKNQLVNYSRLNESRISVARLGIDFKEFGGSQVNKKKIRQKFGLPEEKIIIGCVAFHQPIKGIDVLLDDRGERPGVMFAETDLMGVPHRLVIGERGLAEGMVEYKARTTADAQSVPLLNLVEFVQNIIRA